MLDRSITTPDEDRYGFNHVARQLAQSVKRIGREGSAVIGIEGAWGSGKTSLLNLLRSALEEEAEANTFVLNVSPWLDGGGTSQVESLLLPVAGIIAGEEEKRLSAAKRRRLHQKKELTETAETVLRYSQATARHLAPVAEIAALIPGMPNASGALKSFAAAGTLGKRKTTAELRTEIATKIVELDLSFIVLLDDLDRLEPTQAVEIIRLVKSVADFPRFRYILCYDKTVLAQAIKSGLGVPDGSLYLQKIVQISFSLPRPESFALRHEFLSGAVDLYESVNHVTPDDLMWGELNRVIDIYGASLKTPREVQLALNALVFRYEGIRDYVYLPDLCFLQLVRTTNAGLYDWVEQYMTERSVVESGDGCVGEEEQKELANALAGHLSLFGPSLSLSAFTLGHWVPGVSGFKPENITLFGQTGDEEKAMMTAQRRLASNAYWRYYFAFSSPQNVLSPAYFDDLFRKAAMPEEQPALAQELLERINSNKVSSRTWFEHILSQLTWPMIATRTAEQCLGLMQFFFNHGDNVIERYMARNQWFSLHDLDINSVVDRLMKKIYEENRDDALAKLATLMTEGGAWCWIAEYTRHLLWQHGLAGNRGVNEQNMWLSSEEVESLRAEYAKRLNRPDIKQQILASCLLDSFVWAWRDISGVESVKTWMAEMSADDEVFLNLLLRLRDKGISSATGRYQALNLTQLSEFLGEEDVVKEKLERIDVVGLYPGLMSQIKESIGRSRN